MVQGVDYKSRTPPGLNPSSAFPKTEVPVPSLSIRLLKA